MEIVTSRVEKKHLNKEIGTAEIIRLVQIVSDKKVNRVHSERRLYVY